MIIISFHYEKRASAIWKTVCYLTLLKDFFKKMNAPTSESDIHLMGSIFEFRTDETVDFMFYSEFKAFPSKRKILLRRVPIEIRIGHIKRC